MSRRKVLGAGIIVAVVAVLAVAAYIVMAQWNTEPFEAVAGEFLMFRELHAFGVHRNRQSKGNS